MSNSRRTSVQAAGLVLAGAVAGGVLAASVGAFANSAAPAATGGYGGQPTAGYAAAGAGAPGGPGGHRGPRPDLQAGTVTAVGTNSVGIKTTAGTKNYAVDANSDIDKNGEAKLSDLKVGDAVHFAVRPDSSTIAVLHAGNEALNRPGPGRHHDGPCPGAGMGPRPGASPNASPSSNA